MVIPRRLGSAWQKACTAAAQFGANPWQTEKVTPEVLCQAVAGSDRAGTN